MISPSLILCLCNEHFLLCIFDSRDVLYTFEVFKYSLDVLLPSHPFLSLIHFLMLLLSSFTRCFTSLGVFLLSSMSLRISTSSFETSSVSFAAAVSPASQSSSPSSPSFSP